MERQWFAETVYGAISKLLKLLPEDFSKKLGTLQEPDRTNLEFMIKEVYGNI